MKIRSSSGDRFTPKFIWSGLAALSLGLASLAHAQAPVYEGFNYAGGQDLTTISTTASGLGSWTSTTGGILGTTDATGLTFGNLVTTGGSLDITKPTGGQWQFLSAPITGAGSIADGSTLFGSFLFQYVGPNGGPGSTDNFGVSVGNSTGADHTMALLTKSYLSSPNAGRIGFTDGVNSSLTTGNTPFDGTTYIYIGKWTNLNGASTATGWVLSLTEFNTVTAMGPVTESALTANSLATATVGGTASSFGTSQFVKIGDFMDGDVNYRLDELRFGANLVDVAPLIPEPSSLVSLGLGGLLLCGLKLRRLRG